jgi:hypothetical protein
VNIFTFLKISFFLKVDVLEIFFAHLEACSFKWTYSAPNFGIDHCLFCAYQDENLMLVSQ